MNVLRISAGAFTALTLSSLASGEIGFTQHTLLGNLDGSVEVAVHAADMDADGDSDVLYTRDDPSDQISWLVNDGQCPPAFSAIEIWTGGGGPRSLDSEDIDGDGDLDFAAQTQAGADSVMWFENMGGTPAQFSKHVLASNLNSPMAVAVADFDDDDDQDIAVADRGNDGIYVYKNDGAVDPTFQFQWVSINSPEAWSVGVGHLNADDIPDLLATSFSLDKVAWFDGPTLGVEHVVSEDPDGIINNGNEGPSDRPTSITAADLDGDGDEDLIVTAQTGWQLAWYESDSTEPPTFTGHRIPGDLGFQGLCVEAADLDDDGDVDLVGGFNGALIWFDNLGGSPVQFTSTTLSAGPFQSVAITDLDGDLDLDIVASRRADEIMWFENDLHCRGDVLGDCTTDIFDFGVFSTFFGQSVTPGSNGDLDDDGFVTVFDFGILAGDFGCPQ